MSDCVTLLGAGEALIGSNRSASLPTASLNWGADVSIFEWDGVAVDGFPSRVVNLNLQRKGLAGTIPAELANLTGLEVLELHKNQLVGIVPLELVSLANLTTLDLSENRLTGEIPPEVGRLKELQVLRLFSNVFTGKIPPQLAQLANLRDLSLGANKLTGEIPLGLAQLANLKELDLHSNKLTGEIPPELGQPPKLAILNVQGNRLRGCVPTSLRWADVESELSYCEERPSDGLADLDLGLVAECSNGVVIRDIEGNPGLVGDCVALLGAKDALVGGGQSTPQPDASLDWSADVSIFEWDGVNVSGDPYRVRRLELFRKGLAGMIPAELGRLTGLEVLKIGGHDLTGGDSPGAWPTGKPEDPQPESKPIDRRVARGTRPAEKSCGAGSRLQSVYGRHTCGAGQPELPAGALSR